MIWQSYRKELWDYRRRLKKIMIAWLEYDREELRSLKVL
jgi:hypothetical protein